MPQSAEAAAGSWACLQQPGCGADFWQEDAGILVLSDLLPVLCMSPASSTCSPLGISEDPCKASGCLGPCEPSGGEGACEVCRGTDEETGLYFWKSLKQSVAPEAGLTLYPWAKAS